MPGKRNMIYRGRVLLIAPCRHSSISSTFFPLLNALAAMDRERGSIARQHLMYLVPRKVPYKAYIRDFQSFYEYVDAACALGLVETGTFVLRDSGGEQIESKDWIRVVRS